MHDTTTIISGRRVAREVCRHCGTYSDVIPEHRPADWHATAACAVPDEPIR